MFNAHTTDRTRTHEFGVRAGFPAGDSGRCWLNPAVICRDDSDLRFSRFYAQAALLSAEIAALDSPRAGTELSS